MKTRKRDESGAATATALVWIGVILVFGVACALAVGVITTHRRSQAAADLAALAGAQAHQRGDDGCGAARRLAEANHATLTRCHIDGVDVIVQVATRAPGMLAATGELRARARAGPESGAQVLTPDVP